MSPDSTVALQKKMGENCDAKIKVWKKTIERNKMTIQFLQEVLDQQVPVFEPQDMVVQTEINLEESDDYKSYSPEILAYSRTLLQSVAVDELTDDSVNEVIYRLKGEKLPYYK